MSMQMCGVQKWAPKSIKESSYAIFIMFRRTLRQNYTLGQKKDVKCYTLSLEVLTVSAQLDMALQQFIMKPSHFFNSLRCFIEIARQLSFVEERVKETTSLSKQGTAIKSCVLGQQLVQFQIACSRSNISISAFIKQEMYKKLCSEGLMRFHVIQQRCHILRSRA